MSDSDSTDDIMAQAKVMIARLRALLQTADEVRRQHEQPQRPGDGAQQEQPGAIEPPTPSAEES